MCPVREVATPSGWSIGATGAGAGTAALGPARSSRLAARPKTRQPETIVPATLNTMTMSATWTAATVKKAMAARPSISPICADVTSAETIGTSSSRMMPPPMTTKSGVKAVSTIPRSQPAVSPRVAPNSPRMTKSGPSAIRMPSAMRAVRRMPTVPSRSRIAPIHISPSGDIIEAASAASLAASPAEPPPDPALVPISLMTPKTMSMRSAKICVAEPSAPISCPAIQSGPASAKLQTMP